MSELGGWIYRGGVKQASAKALTVGPDLGLAAGEIEKSGAQIYAYVIAGRGTGQFREVTDNGPDSITVEEPWRVVPDRTSTVALIRTVVRNFIVGNRITDTRGALQFTYGSSFENVIAGNELYEASELTNFAFATRDANVKYGTDYEPVAYNLILNNRMVNSAGIALLSYRAEGAKYGDEVMYQHGALFANTVRRNQIWSPAVPRGANQQYNTWWGSKPDEVGNRAVIAIENGGYNIVESCYVYNAPAGVLISGGKGNVIRNNRIELVAAPFTERQSEDTYTEPPR
jgi:parallel beta-helix repeat protein